MATGSGLGLPALHGARPGQGWRPSGFPQRRPGSPTSATMTASWFELSAFRTIPACLATSSFYRGVAGRPRKRAPSCCGSSAVLSSLHGALVVGPQHGGHSVLISGCSNRLASFGSETDQRQAGPHQLAGGPHICQQGATRAWTTSGSTGSLSNGMIRIDNISS